MTHVVKTCNNLTLRMLQHAFSKATKPLLLITYVEACEALKPKFLRHQLFCRVHHPGVPFIQS